MHSVYAPAKVNLYLHVGPVQSNGRHPLDSLVVFADHKAADIISYEPGPDPITLEITGPGAELLETSPDNLVLRAAHALDAYFNGGKATGKVTLDKRLPIAAGIGGGSSDAAATLHLLNVALDMRIPLADLMKMAVPLGGDVPACLAGRPVLMRGEGERVETVEPPPPVLHAVLATPDSACPTGPVFQAFDRINSEASFTEQAPPSEASVEGWLESLRTHYRNDLQDAARKLVPEIDLALWRLKRCDGVQYVAMSGSGATCFGLFLTEDHAIRAADEISQNYPDWFVRPTVFGPARFDL